MNETEVHTLLTATPLGVNKFLVTFSQNQYFIQESGYPKVSLGDVSRKRGLYEALLTNQIWSSLDKLDRERIHIFVNFAPKDNVRLSSFFRSSQKEFTAHRCTQMLGLFESKAFPQINPTVQQQIVEANHNRVSQNDTLQWSSNFLLAIPKSALGGGKARGAKSSKKAHRNPFRTRSRRRARRSCRRRASRTSRRPRTR